MVVTVLMAGAGGASAQTAPVQAPSPLGPTGTPAPLSIRVSPENARLNNYLRDLAGPGAVVAVVGGGLVSYLRNKPALGDDNSQLASVIASRAGQAAVQVTVRHGLAALMHRSTGYQPCNCSGFGPRVGHALLETFTDRRADGSRALSVPRIAGAYAGSLSRLAWEHDRNAGDLAMSTTLSFGFSALINITRELSGVGR